VGGGSRLIVLPSIRQWENDPIRSTWNQGCDALLNFIRKRFGTDGYTQFFGEGAEGDKKADRLASVCGGHFRDLLRLLREAILRADTWPVTDELLERALVEVRGDYLPIAIEDAIWLANIEELRDCVLPTGDSDDISRLTRFLDTHFVLYLKNGKEWYDIHPLIRGEVAAIVKRHNENNAQPHASV
jgi:hypothetical protein